MRRGARQRVGGWMMAMAVAALAVALAHPLHARERALIAVAANVAPAIAEIARAFETDTGHSLTITTGSTGKLVAQISAAAPFDVLLAADQASPARLEADGLGVAGTRFTYAVGRLVLWSADPDRVGADGAGLLTAGQFRHLAIANPALAPYGAAAKVVLKGLGIWDQLLSNGQIVMGQNIGQAHAMVATGSADLGLVAASALIGQSGEPMKGSAWPVPADLHPPIAQDAILLARAKNNQAAQDFLAYLQSPAAQTILARYGYGRPDAT